MFSNWLMSLYRVFLVLFDSLQVWSCIGWKMDQLEQKSKKKPELEIFTSGTTLQDVLERAEQPECMFQRQRFLRKLQVISGFAVISIFSILAACSLHLSSFSLSLYFSTLFLRQETRVDFLEICDLILCKGRRLHLSHHREDYPEPSFFISFINMQYY